MQPIELDRDGTPRFKENAIVRWLVDSARVNLNDIRVHRFPIEDVEQFWQLLGYSVSGYGELSFTRDETVAEADRIAEALLAKAKR